MPGQMPERDGVKDLPNVPRDIYKGRVPPLGPVGQVPDKKGPASGRSS